MDLTGLCDNVLSEIMKQFENDLAWFTKKTTSKIKAKFVGSFTNIPEPYKYLL